MDENICWKTFLLLFEWILGETTGEKHNHFEQMLKYGGGSGVL